MSNAFDFCIVGGGIIGLNIARELRRRFGRGLRIAILEKEKACGLHGSGRNSGVLHAGFYYTADSLKARFCRDGNRALTEFCQDRGITLNPCGKLVVARNESEATKGLDELLRRARANGVELHKISAAEAREIEPRVLTHEHALWSPTTKSADNGQVTQAMMDDVMQSGTVIIHDAPFISAESVTSVTSSTPSTSISSASALASAPWRIRAGSSGQHVLECAHFVNAAGLYADRVAHQFGFAHDYTMLPFKGIYLYCHPERVKFRTHIYPVPNLNTPFLGVHFTLTVDGVAKIGPTAIPGFWRENYNMLDGFSAPELADILTQQSRLVAGSLRSLGTRALTNLSNLLSSSSSSSSAPPASKSDFSSLFVPLAIQELRKYRRANLVDDAAQMIAGLSVADTTKYGRAGIRAQLFNKRTAQLEMDFIIEGDARSTHVINVISPGWTCSIPFAAHVVDAIEAKWKAQQQQQHRQPISEQQHQHQLQQQGQASARQTPL